MTKKQNDRISKLEIELKRRDAHITELTEQRDKEQKLNEQSRDGLRQWDAAFDAYLERISPMRAAPTRSSTSWMPWPKPMLASSR